MIRKHIAAKYFLNVGYDAPTKTLEIEFKNGVITEFSNVPKEINDALWSSSDRDKYFEANIENRFTRRDLQ